MTVFRIGGGEQAKARATTRQRGRCGVSLLSWRDEAARNLRRAVGPIFGLNHLPLHLIVMTENTLDTSRPRVLSGMRPTGRLHLGNYMGALYNWVQLQRQYECYFFIADFHALTTDYADPSLLKQNVYEVALDFFSAGLDPAQCTVFVQSHVPQHAELHLLFSMFTPLSWLERVPTYKDQQEQLKEKDLATYGFLGYPLLQSADILLYQPDFVPVGQDQVAHVELTREVGRRFNHLYSPRRVVPGTYDPKAMSVPTEVDPDRILLKDPQVLLTPSPKLPGTDGRKMSKSYGNSILLSDVPGDVLLKMLSMSNGGQRPTQNDPGDPEICPVGDMHRLFSPEYIDTHIRTGCRTATIRCDQCKEMAGNSINAHLVPIRAQREKLEADPDLVWDALDAGAERARARSEQTMVSLRAATGLSRDRSGVRTTRSGYSDQESRRNLSQYRAWWNIEPAIMIRNLQSFWRSDLLPSEARVRPDADSVYVTRNGKRAFVTAACELPEGGEWLFAAKPKSYEVLVLLCWGADMGLHDFVIPQKLYVARWTAYKKAHKDEVIPFWITKRGAEYHLHFRDSEPPIPLDGLEAQYAPLQ
jgi:tryptophanyl-tRNA synthetase